ncbi:TetR/AcrR family transcriptional regulator [Bombilactobacillus thymidiniphilus]|uniref:TetR/AcrR family transcriptional regulator n=1 Tax=Bombilactobacillus thymidiniphilus TaxID=2923363 RepID=A0ABY4PC69_9LACO|nr:TetR/AcrR family transcriptional regulator [Bombilactobacillus thymidiniphilus]UQS83360.1 TetR/AcrR family transcriptional regulator [Bombilactobacillus thymidiniphilus]
MAHQNKFNFSEWLMQTPMPEGKRKIIQASVKLFAQRGYQATTTAAIAQEAGMSDATMFKYFKSKQALLDAIIMPLIEEMIPTLTANFADTLSEQSTSIDDLIAYFIADRYAFVEQNYQLVLILLNQLLVDSKLRSKVIMQLEPNLQKILQVLQRLLATDPQVAANWQASDVLQLIASQLLTQFICHRTLNLSTNDQQVNKLITLVQHALRP